MSCTNGHTPIQAPTAVVRTAAQKKVGGFRKEFPHSGDTELWLRLAAEGAVGFVDAEQAFRRIHNTNMSWNYSVLARLQDQMAAFDSHFWEYGAGIRDAGRLQQVLGRTLGEAAFWGRRTLRPGRCGRVPGAPRLCPVRVPRAALVEAVVWAPLEAADGTESVGSASAPGGLAPQAPAPRTPGPRGNSKGIESFAHQARHSPGGESKLMKPAVAVTNLSKQYQIGGRPAGEYATLRESLMRLATARCGGCATATGTPRTASGRSRTFH